MLRKPDRNDFLRKATSISRDRWKPRRASCFCPCSWFLNR